MQYDHQPQHIDTISTHKTKNNYNSIELHPRPNPYAYTKKHQYQTQQQINYPNSIVHSHGGGHFIDAPTSNHHNNYFYKVENFTSFGTISCSAENQYGSSGPCLYHIMVAGKELIQFILSCLFIWSAVQPLFYQTPMAFNNIRVRS